MHKTLVRQIQHALGDNPVISEELRELFESISVTYEDFDKDRALIERSLEISSEELKAFISLLQATLDSTDEGILVIDGKGKITNYNKRIVEILETKDDVLSTHDADKLFAHVAEEIIDPALFTLYVGRVLDSTDTKGGTVLHFKNGKIVEMNSKPQLFEGKSVGLVWSFQDVTSLLKAENELRTKIDALERLNKTMIDREIKMVELKKKIRTLEEEQSASLVETAPKIVR